MKKIYITLATLGLLVFATIGFIWLGNDMDSVKIKGENIIDSIASKEQKLIPIDTMGNEKLKELDLVTNTESMKDIEPNDIAVELDYENSVLLEKVEQLDSNLNNKQVREELEASLENADDYRRKILQEAKSD